MVGLARVRAGDCTINGLRREVLWCFCLDRDLKLAFDSAGLALSSAHMSVIDGKALSWI